MSQSATFLLSLPTEQGRLGKPRLDSYSKLMARFYEAFFLLCSLGQTRDGFTEYPRPGSPQQDIRREYLRDLAFICDGKKGGDTFVAFSVAESEQNYTFYMASKSPRKQKLMLQRSLRALVAYASAPENQKEKLQREFLQMCIKHAEKRISAYKANLLEAIPHCIDELVDQDSRENQGLIKWLQHLRARCDDSRLSDLDVCMDMYKISMPELMMKLSQKERLQQHRYAKQGLYLDTEMCLSRAKHAIGRLAARIHKPLSLLRNANSMKDILENSCVEIIAPIACAPKPEPDSHTTLPGVLRRMFRDDDPEMPRTRQALLDLQDTSLKPLHAYMECDRQCSPFVHSEICVLEYFYKQNLQFLDGDRYVYASKPACFMCKLYFAEHPARMVVPESHGKAYLNWGPPLVENFRKKDPESDRQRDLMILITKAVRGAVIDQLWRRTVPPGWHPDSTTGAPSTLLSLSGLPDEFSAPVRDYRFITPSSDSGFGSSAENGMLHNIEEHSDETSSPALEDTVPREEQQLEADDSDDEGGALL